MTRAVSTEFQDGMDAQIPEPAWLVEALLTPPLYWSTQDGVTWNDKTWTRVGLEIQGPSETGAVIKIRNDDNSGSALVLNNLLRDIEFRIYLYYNGAAIEMFRGYGSDSSLGKMAVTINLLPNRAINAKVPRKRLAAPTFTHLPKLGEVIRWGTESYKVTF